MSLKLPSPHENGRAMLLTAIISLAVLFLGMRTYHAFQRINSVGLPPKNPNARVIRGWMTVPYVARVYAIPEEYIYAKLGINPAGNEEKSLLDLNEMLFPEQPGFIIAKMEEIMQEFANSGGQAPPTP